MQILTIIPKKNPNQFRRSSINFFNLRSRSPSNLTNTLIGTKIELNMKEGGRVINPASGLLTIDWTVDLKNWIRLNTSFVDEKSKIQFDIPSNNYGKGFFRAHVNPLK